MSISIDNIESIVESTNIKVLDAFAIMNSKRTQFQVIHQTGREDYKKVAQFYIDKGIVAYVRPFFEHMMEIYLLSDLVISRAGAGTVSEI